MACPTAATFDGDAPSPVIRQPEFVGRERELAAIARALADPPTIVLIEGEAGQGKTRLIGEFLASAAGRAGTAVVACCPAYHQPHTLGPLADALRQVTGDVADLGLSGLSGLAGALRPLFPEWAAGLPPLPEPLEDATAARHRLFGAVAELLDRLDVSVLVVEDVHWADEATLEFLLFLASRLPRRVSVVISARPEDVPAGSLLPRLARHAAGSSGLQVALNPLNVDDTAQLVSSMLAGEHISGAFASFLHERTGGVPLAVEESVRLMADRADLVRRNGEWARRHLEDIPVPHTVRDAVLERMARLSQDAQVVLEAAAVVASPAPHSLLAVVAGLAAGRASGGLGEALGCNMLGEDRRGLVSFKHALACQAVYEAVPAPHRRLLHRRAGLALEGSSPSAVVQLARHFREAGESAKWSIYAEQAADIGLSAGDEATAVAVLGDLIAEGGQIGFRAASQLEKTAYGSIADPGRYRHLIEALRLLLSSGTGGAGEVAQARFQLGRLLRLTGDYEAGNAELKQAVPHLVNDPGRAARAMTMLGWPFGTASPAPEHRRWLDRAAQLEASLDPADRLRVLSQRTTALLLLGEEEGWRAASIPETSADHRERQFITVNYLNTGDLAIAWGRYADARRRLARGADLAERYGYARHQGLIHATQAHLDWLTGQWEGLAEHAQHIADAAGPIRGSYLEAALVISLMNAANGDSGSAEASLRAILHERQQRGEIPYMMAPAAALASWHLVAGQVEDALEVTQQPMSLLTSKEIWLWGTELVPARADALVAVGQVAQAADLVAQFAQGLRGRRAPAPWAALALCRAILAQARGEHARAALSFGRAAEAWQELPRPYDALLARERQASCQVAAGQRDEGLALLTAVFEGLSELGAAGDAERVRCSLGENGVRTWRGWRGGRRGYGDQLSPRELEVVQLLVAGHARREIARALFRSPKTVDAQVKSAMVKLGVSSRAALAARAVEAGIASGS